MREKKVKVGVVGIGHLGTYHLQKYQRIGASEIVAVVDVCHDRAEQAARVYGGKAFNHHRDILHKVEAVSIAVPATDHYAVAKDFLSAGVDVLLEKPMCRTLEEADALIDMAARNKCVLQVGFVERFNPAVMALANVIRNPLFIESHRLHPFFERGTDVDVIMDLMIHDLDIILEFVKAEVIAVDAVGVPVLSDKIDIANVRLSFSNGCTANVTASRISAKAMQKIRFFSPAKYHAIDYRKREVVSLGQVKDESGQVRIVQDAVAVGSHDPLEEEIRAFIGSVMDRSEPLVSGREARKSLALALQIQDKIRTAENLF